MHLKTHHIFKCIYIDYRRRKNEFVRNSIYWKGIYIQIIPLNAFPINVIKNKFFLGFYGNDDIFLS